MKKSAVPFSILSVVVVLGSVAAGTPFVYPPETHAPGWVSSFPYQRNMLWDFDRDPSIAPTTYNGDAFDVRYAGYDDPYLWTEDAVTMAGAMTWFSAAGAVGIDNSNGRETASGSILFYLNNHNRRSEFKHVWVETPYLNVVGATGAPVDAVPPAVCIGSPVPGATISFTNFPDNQMHTWYVEIPENPPYETFEFKLDAEPGQLVLLDYVHIATECAVVVPAPGAGLLAALGAGCLGWIRRRRSL